MQLKSIEMTVTLGFLIASALIALWVWRGYSKDRQQAAALPQVESQAEVHHHKTLSDVFDDGLIRCLFVIEAMAVTVALVVVFWVLLSGLHYLWTHPLF